MLMVFIIKLITDILLHSRMFSVLKCLTVIGQLKYIIILTVDLNKHILLELREIANCNL